MEGLSPIPAPCFKGFLQRHNQSKFPTTTQNDSGRSSVSVHSPLLRDSRLVSLVLNYMLKFSTNLAPLRHYRLKKSRDSFSLHFRKDQSLDLGTFSRFSCGKRSALRGACIGKPMRRCAFRERALASCRISHGVSQFAASFLDTRANAATAKRQTIYLK